MMAPWSPAFTPEASTLIGFTNAKEKLEESDDGREALPAARPARELSTVAAYATERFLRPLGDDVMAACVVCTFDDVRNSVRGLDELVKNKQQRKLKILHRMDPILAGIEQYSNIFDVFMQTDLLILAPLWGSVRLLVQVLRSYMSYVVQILDMLEQIQLSIPRHCEYAVLFPDKMRLSKAVVSTYLLIVEFCVKIRNTLLGVSDSEGFLDKFKRQTCPIRRSFESIFGSIVKGMQIQKEQIENEARAAGLHSLVRLTAESKARHDLVVDRSRYSEKLQSQALITARTTQKATDSLNDTLSLEVHHQRINEICNWLQRGLNENEFFNKNRFEKLCNDRHRGTCEWLFDTPEFIRWSSQEQGMLECS